MMCAACLTSESDVRIVDSGFHSWLGGLCVTVCDGFRFAPLCLTNRIESRFRVHLSTSSTHVYCILVLSRRGWKMNRSFYDFAISIEVYEISKKITCVFSSIKGLRGHMYLRMHFFKRVFFNHWLMALSQNCANFASKQNKVRVRCYSQITLELEGII